MVSDCVREWQLSVEVRHDIHLRRMEGIRPIDADIGISLLENIILKRCKATSEIYNNSANRRKPLGHEPIDGPLQEPVV